MCVRGAGVYVSPCARSQAPTRAKSPRAYRSERVLPTWDDTVERLLKEAW